MSHLSTEALSVEGIVAHVRSPERGGLACFVGSVRPDAGAVAIEYSAYVEMAEHALEQILEEARDRWPQAAVDVAHRLGRIPVGEASVVVAAAAPHRTEAFDACRYVIEALKDRVPIWKREETADGQGVWVENRGARLAASPPPPEPSAPGA